MHDARTLEAYRKILDKARIPQKHLAHIKQPNKSDELVSGQASQRILTSIVARRTFDCYNRPVKDEIDESKLDIIASKAAHRDLLDIRAEAANQVSEQSQNPAWKIGTKPPSYGPPGLRPPIQAVSNSEGNENFFPGYDGEWKDGDGTGKGVYTFSDGSTHEGTFKQNVPDGPGKAVYSGGTVYIGDFKNGYPSGLGRCSYRGGVVYDGTWKQGKRDGQGTVTYPNGSCYNGGFRRGHFHGRGTFKSSGSGLVFKGEFQRGKVSGTGTFTYPDGKRVTKTWPRDSDKGLNIFEALAYIEEESANEKRALQGPIDTERLDIYVKKVKDNIKAKRRKEKEDMIEARRKTIRDMRAKNREGKSELKIT